VTIGVAGQTEHVRQSSAGEVEDNDEKGMACIGNCPVIDFSGLVPGKLQAQGASPGEIYHLPDSQ
jgi:hypothetical protein